ncbi:amidohydrolase [Natronosporangium hydrolyticum]|uniref:Amidohydrolase n=1 Tax=Natronosporangium hydrolyticum TaxID=2811111 RepID=A0A895YJZ7_9ACTN|nr:amidohydrolase family protein [Natronosporangium hydrolyticum]QSB16335.1 amidohydrolase [Natronosporangium hydrolyticum]
MTIDVHGHLSPPESLRRFPMPPRLGDVTGMIEAKLALGVSMTVIGSPVGAGAMVPIPGVDNYAQSEDQLRGLHEWLASVVADHPQHLRSYVYVNPFGGDAHLANAAEWARQPEFVGVIANSSISGRYLLGPEADAFFGFLAELDLPLFLHPPASPAAGTGLQDLPLIEQLGRFCDITIGLACCVLGGWLEKYPSLRILASAGGGALGLLPEKLDQAWAPAHWGGRPGAVESPLPRPPSSYLDRIWVDTATPSPAALTLALATVGPRRVVFGTDSPPLPPESVGGLLKTIGDAAIPAQTRDGVLAGNARELFGARLGDPSAAIPAAVGETARSDQ